MKEEVGMKRKSARALAGALVMSTVMLAAGAALAQEDVYENISGLNWSTAAPGLAGARFPLQGGGDSLTGFAYSNATYNPNGIGQYLFGQYYDVRPYTENGANDAQVVNIAIVNTNSNNTSLPPCTVDDVLQGRDGENCYFDQGQDNITPKGGILAKIRFRESKFSSEVLDFNIALSCGEVWTARVQLGANGRPELFSEYPIVTSVGSDSKLGIVLRTKPAFKDTPVGFSIPSNRTSRVSNLDTQRGYLEVIGVADLPCEPVDKDGNSVPIDLVNGNVWKTNSAFNATNALAGEAFITRAASGVSFAYPFEAITRYRALYDIPNRAPSTRGIGLSPQITNAIFSNDFPTLKNCLLFDINSNPAGGDDNCTRQFNLALAKGRLVSQYDISPVTAGKANFIVTLPTKYANCNFGGGKTFPTTPFSCDALNGEPITCTLYDRLENLADEGFVSPTESDSCSLPRELTILGLETDENPPRVVSYNYDFSLGVPDNFLTPAGWLALELDNDAAGEVIHREIFANDSTFDVLGGRVRGYRGLPALGLRLQQYENGALAGTYGALVKMQGDDPVLFIGQS